jgi:hypothetical protein
VSLLAVERSIWVSAFDVWQESIVVLGLQDQLLLLGEEGSDIRVRVLGLVHGRVLFRVLVLIVLNCVVTLSVSGGACVSLALRL